MFVQGDREDAIGSVMTLRADSTGSSCDWSMLSVDAQALRSIFWSRVGIRMSIVPVLVIVVMGCRGCMMDEITLEVMLG